MLETQSPSLGTWACITPFSDLGISLGKAQKNCTIANSKQTPGTPLLISLRWLECVDDEMSALAVNFSLYGGASTALASVYWLREGTL